MRSKSRPLVSGTILLAMGILLPFAAMAQATLPVSVTTNVACAEASFQIEVNEGAPPFTLEWTFGDGESETYPDVSTFPFSVNHTYPEGGQYSWDLIVYSGSEFMGTAMGTITINGPQATLTSDPFPPLIDLAVDDGVITFDAEVAGGSPPYNYEWDLDADGTPEATGLGPVSHTYTEAGSYTAEVVVTDSCGLSGSDTLPVVVQDSNSEEGGECHPMAERIANAVNTLFPDQAESLYTCEEIFDFFNGGLTGSQLGFGQMWHAYQLTSTISDMTWEEIRDWKLDGNGWGLLLQLQRFADALDEVGITELVERVLSGENTVQDIRHAARAAVRLEADFEDALERLSEGASPGELNQVYRTSEQLAIDPDVLDEYLEMGLSLPELQHAGRLAERMNADWAEIAASHASGHSWGEIQQALKLADGDTTPGEILEMGIQEFRRQQREEAQEERNAERIERTTARIAQQFGVPEEAVRELFEGTCEGDWSCVRKQLREQAMEQNQEPNAEKTAARLAKQYGVSEAEVWSLYEGSCDGDWGCVRSALREAWKEDKPKGKPDK